MGSAGDTNADRPEDGAPDRLRHASRKCDAGGSEEISRLPRFYQPPRMVARHAGGDAASGRAAIDLAIGEHAQIAGRRGRRRVVGKDRSEEHTSELQSLMRISYAVFCLKKKKKKKQSHTNQCRISN